MGIIEKIKETEAEIARTQINKHTEYHLGRLKAKLAKLRGELLEAATKASGATKGDGFEVEKSGDARISLIGFPSVGKSTLLTKLTSTASAIAAYEFTTLTCVPGVINFKGAHIQLLDTPGIIEGAAEGKGRGKQVIAVARTADLIVMLLDAQKGELQKQILTRELETMGVRLNRKRPDIYFKPKTAGGLVFTSTVPLTHIDTTLAYTVLSEYKIHDAEIIVKYDATVDDLIDVIEGKRVYIPCLYLYNKIDQVSIEKLDALASQENSFIISCEMDLNMDYLLDKLWEMLSLIRVYTKKQGEAPDFNGPMIIRNGSTVKNICHMLHRDLVSNFKYALVWGRSAKHTPQVVGLDHVLSDEDVIQVAKKSVV